MYPDIETDRELYDALKTGKLEKWRSRTSEQVEDSGHQELLNWYCVVGAMNELGLKLDYSTFIEGWLSNSPKCFAIWRQ
jgi:hypothetical protein